MKPPACYGAWPARRSIRLTLVAGYFAWGPCAQLKGPPWPQATPDVPVTPEQLADWRQRHPAATCSDKVAAILAQIERDFAPRPT